MYLLSNECTCSLKQEIRRKRDEEQERHTKVLEEGRKIIELNYVDLDKDHTDRLDQITKRWSTLWEKCDQWHLVVTTKLNLKLVDVKSSSKDKEVYRQCMHFTSEFGKLLCLHSHWH